MNSRSLLLKTISGAALAAVLAAPLLAPPAALAKKKPSVDISKLAWPPPPRVARIRYLTEIHGEDVQGKKKQGFLERMAGVPEDTGKDNLTKPLSVAADSRGRAFVTDSLSRLVFIFDIENKTVGHLGENVSFRKPTGIAVDDQDRVYVADIDAHTVYVFSPAGDLVTEFGAQELGRPNGIAIDSALGRLYISDLKARKIAQYELATLKFQRWIGRSWDEKVGAEEQDKVLNAPTDLAVDADGLLYVVDTYLDHVVVFDTDGEFVRKLGTIGAGPGKFMRPRGIAIDSDGHVYVGDAMANLFQILTPDGKALMPIGGLGTDPGKFIVPASIAIDRHNRVYVTDQGNRRIQVFRYVTEAEAQAEAAKRGKNVVAPSDASPRR